MRSKKAKTIRTSWPPTVVSAILRGRAIQRGLRKQRAKLLSSHLEKLAAGQVTSGPSPAQQDPPQAAPEQLPMPEEESQEPAE